ncbi:MAG: hypothetical protein R3C56_14540 [Pirellulaceae bacterium]
MHEVLAPQQAAFLTGEGNEDDTATASGLDLFSAASAALALASLARRRATSNSTAVPEALSSAAIVNFDGARRE